MRSRAARVRRPRSTSQASSGLTVMPKASQRSASGSQQSRVVATVPIITSEWPDRYLVAAMTEMSAPSASGRYCTPEPQVLSTITSAPRRCAMAASAGRSHIS